jgi:hypothetical protein
MGFPRLGMRRALACAAFLAALTFASAALADYTGPATVTHPTGNHTRCTDFGYESSGVYAEGANGVYNRDEDGNLLPVAVIVSNYQEGTGQDPATFDWTSTTAISAVFVKAGPNNQPHTLYTYMPPLTSDTGLESHEPSVSHLLFCYTPTAVRLRAFDASRTGRGVTVSWQTASEAGTMGFNVWRQQGNRRLKVNARLIRARAGVAGGHSYRLVDRRAGKRYWLEAWSASGARSWAATAVATG